jgi:hypothetical protein
VLLDLCEYLLLQRQVFQYGLDHEVRIAYCAGNLGHGMHALDCRLVVSEILEVGEEARLRAVEARRHAIVDAHVMAGEREDLRDPVPHETGADDGNARIRRQHRHPAV